MEIKKSQENNQSKKINAMTEQLEILRTFQRKKNRKEEQEDYYKPV